MKPPVSPNSNYDDMDIPSPDFPQSSKNVSIIRSPPTDSGYGGSTRRPSEDSSYRRPSEDGGASYRRRPSEDNYGNRNEDGGYGYSSSRRKPSQDVVANLRGEERRRPSPDLSLSGRRSGEDDRNLARRPSGSVSTTSDSTNATNAQREVIIPNKSIIAEEDIEVPYGRERESSSTAVGGRASRSPDNRDRSPDMRGDTDGDGITDNEPSNARSPQLEVRGLGGLSGLSGLTARLRDNRNVEDDEEEWSGTGRSGGEDYFDKMSLGRVSVTSDRSAGGAGGGMGQNSRSSGGNLNSGRMSKNGGSFEDVEALRRDYEYKIATMQSKIGGLERSLEEAEERGKRMRDESAEEKARVLEEEIRFLRDVSNAGP
jgi:protein SPA2